jgi:Tol biopolymer transport system component
VVSNDGNTLWFMRIALPSQTRSIETLTLPNGNPTVWQTDAHRPALSPDGSQIAYANSADMSKLYVTTTDGNGTPTLVANVAGTKPTWSPDGDQIAYLLWDDNAICAHVEIVEADGSTAESPTRITDCSATGEQITQIAWFVRP